MEAPQTNQEYIDRSIVSETMIRTMKYMLKRNSAMQQALEAFVDRLDATELRYQPTGTGGLVVAEAKRSPNNLYKSLFEGTPNQPFRFAPPKAMPVSPGFVPPSPGAVPVPVPAPPAKVVPTSHEDPHGVVTCCGDRAARLARINLPPETLPPPE